MSLNILQINLNRSRQAYDVLSQHSLELGWEICAISEPGLAIMGAEDWVTSEDGLAAIGWNGKRGIICRLAEKGKSFICVSCGTLKVVSCYVSPNAPREALLEFLDDLERLTRINRGKIVICGDFNAHSKTWGNSHTDREGELVKEWAAACDLRLLNSGKTATCIRTQGTSIIDLTWASPKATNFIKNWKVREEMESGSDHNYIIFEYSNRIDKPEKRKARSETRWNLKGCKWEDFEMALNWKCAVGPAECELEETGRVDRQDDEGGLRRNNTQKYKQQN